MAGLTNPDDSRVFTLAEQIIAALPERIKVKDLKNLNRIIWRHPRKSGLTPKTTKARVIRYAII